MQISTLSNTKSYQNKDDKTNQLIKPNDIVRAKRKHFMIDSVNNNALTGTDMYGNKLDFFIEDVEKIIFDSSKQTTIETFLQEDKLQNFRNSLSNINNYLQSDSLNLKRIKDLKKLRIKIKKQINDLEKENKQIA